MASLPAPPSPAAVVPLLSTQSFHCIINHIWRNSGVVDKLIHYIHCMICKSEPTYIIPQHKMEEYYRRIDEIAAQIITWDFLPRPTVIKLGNCLLDHDKNMRSFITSLCLALVKPTKENIKLCVDKIAMTPAGCIDKKKTIIEIAVFPDREVFFTKRFTSNYCVGLVDVTERILEDPVEAIKIIADPSCVRYFPKGFGDPQSYWESKSQFNDMRDHELQFIAMHGSLEALEFFRPKMHPLRLQRELSQAAMWTTMNNLVEIPKVFYFYRYMEREFWVEFLKRNFFSIFTEFLASKRYRHMCTVFYYQVLDTIDVKAIDIILQYLSVQCSSQFTSPVHRDLYIPELEVTFINMWRMTPKDTKERLDQTNLYKILLKVSMAGRYNILAAIVEDALFSIEERANMIGCIVMNCIIFDKNDEIGPFLKKLKPGCCNVSKVSDLLSEESIKVFIAVADGCRNVEKYDKLFSYKFMHLPQTQAAKRNLLENSDFFDQLINGVINATIEFINFKKLVWWCFSYVPYLVRRFYMNTLLPNKASPSTFKYHMVGSCRSDEIQGLFFDEFQMHSIRASIVADRETVFRYCADFLLELDFKALRRLFQNLCLSIQDIASLMNSFYESDIGIKTVFKLIAQNTYDLNYYWSFEFKNKLKAFLQFRQFWLLSDEMALYLDGILARLGHPNSINFKIRLSDYEVSLLPHESYHDRRIILDANYRIFRASLNSRETVELISETILSRSTPASMYNSLTDLSLVYEMESGISVPVVICEGSS